MKGTNDETLEEQDIQLREIKQFHKDIDQMLVNVMENAEIHIILQTYFEQVIEHNMSVYLISFLLQCCRTNDILLLQYNILPEWVRITHS